MSQNSIFSHLKVSALASAIALTGILAGCGGGSSTKSVAVTAKSVATTNADIAFAVFSDSVSTAQKLKTAVDAFVDDPTQAKMDAAKKAWEAAREPYGQSEVYRFGNAIVDEWEGKVNAWPLGEAMIDYVASKVDGNDAPDAAAPAVAPNIIADLNANVTSTTILAGLNESNGDERNVATGYHAIEFMLWGQDLNAGTTEWDGAAKRDATAGQRPISDYSTTAGTCTSGANHAIQTDEKLCQRRGQYLKTVTQLLIEDLQFMANEWDPAGTNNYYDTYVAGGEESIKKMMAGMGRLSFGELAGERINIALVTQDQEEEHSCFSDNTHRDIALNAQGVQNAFLGKYTRVDGSVVQGSGLDAYLREKGFATIADGLTTKFTATKAATDKVSDTATGGLPFDSQIQGSAQNIADIDAVIDALRAQTNSSRGASNTPSIESAAQALGIDTGDLTQDTDAL